MYKGKTLCRGQWVAPLFWPIMVQKIHCVFRPTKWTRKKSARTTHRKKLPPAIFACPCFANKIISAPLKLSAKNGLRPSHEPACDLSANHADKKRELVTAMYRYILAYSIQFYTHFMETLKQSILKSILKLIVVFLSLLIWL